MLRIVPVGNKVKRALFANNFLQKTGIFRFPTKYQVHYSQVLHV